MHAFTAPWDRRLRVGTLLFAAVMLAVALVIPVQPGWFWGIKAAILLMVVASWAWAPTGYRIASGELIVTRAAGGIRVPLSGLRSARRMAPAELRGAATVFASGGFFGYYGRFLVGVEEQTWHVTDLSKGVRLELPGRVVVVSPSDPAAFLAAIGAPRHTP